MEKQVIFRDRQELQAADLNNVQTYAAEAFQHLIQDAVTVGKAFTGGLVAAASATEITVAAPLRFYNNGLCYVVETAQTLNLFQYLPLVTKKIVAVVVWGQQTDTDVEPRDFLVDLTTGATEPQAVAMEQLNACNVNLLPGAESADPQPPVIQTGTLAIAYVTLTPTGIESIAMQTGSELPDLADHAGRIEVMEIWKGVAEPRISSIATDLAGLASKTDSKADRESIVQLANDIKVLKEQLVAPAAAITTTGNYGDPNQAGTGTAGYAALVRDGILFPAAASQSSNLALFNPIDASVAVASNQVLPAYTSAARLQTTGYSGDVALSGFQVQARSLTKLKARSHSLHYGPHGNHHAKWYARHGWDLRGKDIDFETPNFGFIKIKPKDHYEQETTSTDLSGTIIAQTVLVPNAMWLTEVGLSFTQVAASGDITLAVTGTVGGKPDLTNVLAMVTVAQANLATYPDETRIPVPPVFLGGGGRYALAVITQGDHRIALVSGGDNTQGTLFYGLDSGFSVHSHVNDLLFTLYAAGFATTRTEVMLQAVSLAGGLTDIAIEAQHLIPKGCELFYEIQPTGAGSWYPLGDSTLRLAGLPNLVNLRAVMLGTKDLAPAFTLTENAVTVSRSGDSLVFFSTARTVAATTSVILSALVHNWDAVNHTLTPKVVVGGTEYAASVTTYVDEDGARRFKYTFTVPSTTSYTIKLTGAKTAGAQPFSVVELIDSSL